MSEEKKPLVVNIFDKARLDATGVVEIVSSTDKEIYVKLEDSTMAIFGEKMTITKLIPNEKMLSVSGVILGVSYLSKPTKKAFFSKVFK